MQNQLNKIKQGSKKVTPLLLALMLLLAAQQQQAQPLIDEVMLKRLQATYNNKARKRGELLMDLLTRLQNKNVKQQMSGVNNFFNQFPYRDDLAQWGQKDYWATPEEFIGVNKGDCEDYVIAKYFALRALGVPDKHLYLTYVKAVRQNKAHMVLSYFKTPQSIPLILDNYDQRILAADKRKDLKPVYSFNAKSLFLTNASAGLGKALPTDKIKNSKWDKLLSSLKKAKP